jgi:hypothetical protein
LLVSAKRYDGLIGKHGVKAVVYECGFAKNSKRQEAAGNCVFAIVFH